MSFQKYLMPLCIASGVAVSPGVAMAQNDSASPAFEPFTAFVAKLHSTTADQMTAQQSAAVKTTAAAEEMRQHLLKLYAGVSVAHSYELRGQIFDCVPINEQPSVRQLGLRSIASPPSISPPSKARTGVPQTSQRNVTGIDAFGHKQVCNSGSIPMRRITLQEMSRFPTLHDFLAKGPNGAGQVRPRAGKGSLAAPQSALPPGREDAAIAYQLVPNYGAFTTLSLYSPFVDTGLGQVFSSSYLLVEGLALNIQGAQIGVMNFPAHFGSQNSVLFTSWTADGYQQTGCFNLDCGAFVQTSNITALGAPFPNYSTDGGVQVEAALGTYFSGGNWWMYVNGDWVGYYPGSIYNGGQLSQFANLFALGGVTLGGASYPPMGSGEFAAAEYPHAAYHRLISYIDTAYNGQYPSLGGIETSHNCYTFSGIKSDNISGIFFFFGGPGGPSSSLPNVVNGC